MSKTMIIGCAVCLFSLLLLTAVNAEFINNGDGTVTDNIRGLMWQQEDDNSIQPWDKDFRYCESLSLSTYTDWRVPNRDELRSIVDKSKLNPTIDANISRILIHRSTGRLIRPMALIYTNRQWTFTAAMTSTPKWQNSTMSGVCVEQSETA